MLSCRYHLQRFEQGFLADAVALCQTALLELVERANDCTALSEHILVTSVDSTNDIRAQRLDSVLKCGFILFLDLFGNDLRRDGKNTQKSGYMSPVINLFTSRHTSQYLTTIVEFYEINTFSIRIMGKILPFVRRVQSRFVNHTGNRYSHFLLLHNNLC